LFRESAIPLSGTTADALMDELIAHGDGWDFVDLTPKLKSRPVLVITADDNSPNNSRRLALALRAAGGPVSEIHFPTDHPYSDHRIALASAIVRWLENRQPAGKSEPTRHP